jgi:alpha-glucosidase
MAKSWRDVNVVYQIYPRSFKDTNSDGVGDIAGIAQGLDYISKVLGAEAIWISPFFPSPQADCGYDVSDYCAVDSLFGSMADFDELLAAAHERGLKVMLDLVPNHTSDQHPWFQESRSSRDNQKRDWYVWRDAPNNWLSVSGGSSWELDTTTNQYYLHSFMSSQPDLNWENPAVRQAIQDVMRFWFNKGVDGFRVDAVWALSKDTTFADDPINETFVGESGTYGSFVHKSCKNGPRLAEYLHELTAVAAEFSDKYLLFEFYPDTMLGDENEQLKQLHDVAPEIAAPFYFEGLQKPWHATGFGEAMKDYLDVVPEEARPSICFSNHDQPRLVSRYGAEQARLIAMLQMTLPGLPVMYYGDEIGMENVPIPPELTKDKFEKTGDSGGRDPGRTPMQWDDSALAGFTTVSPWLPIGQNTTKSNVVGELHDPDSWLSLYRRLLELRKEAVMQRGSFEIVSAGSGYVLAYKRTLGDVNYYVVCNFAAAMQILDLPVPMTALVAETHINSTVIRPDGRVSLQGFGAAILSGAALQDS